MKNTITLILLVTLILSGSLSALGNCSKCSKKNLPIKSNIVEFNIMGQQINVDPAPQIINESIFIPARATFEHIAYQTSWDSEKRIATFSASEGHTISLEVGNKNAIVDGEKHLLSSQPAIKDERMLVAPEIVEALGYWWQWNPDELVININKYEWSES